MKLGDRIRLLFTRRSSDRGAETNAGLPAVDSVRGRRNEVIETLAYTPTEDLLEPRAELQAAAQEAGLTPNEIEHVLNARPDLPRPLVPIERDTLLAILNHADFEGRDELISQVDSASVDGYCGCGCATVSLVVQPEARRAPTALRMIPNSARVFDAEGEEIGGIIVFLLDGYLSFLEIYDYLDGISPLPPIDRLVIDTERPTLE
jgi:hypothetical protein